MSTTFQVLVFETFDLAGQDAWHLEQKADSISDASKPFDLVRPRPYHIYDFHRKASTKRRPPGSLRKSSQQQQGDAPKAIPANEEATATRLTEQRKTNRKSSKQQQRNALPAISANKEAMSTGPTGQQNAACEQFCDDHILCTFQNQNARCTNCTRHGTDCGGPTIDEDWRKTCR